MIKHIPEDLSVVFSEVPDEVTLAFNISNCQNNCRGCHSPYLKTDIGEELTAEKLDSYITKNAGITCVCFMGEGNDKEALLSLVNYLSAAHPELKRAIYSGRTLPEPEYYDLFDYIKVGPYVEVCGPLNSRTTNQRLFKKFGQGWEEITYRFWGESFKDHEKAQYILSDNEEHNERIKKAIERKTEKFGKGYCPCVTTAAHSDKTICPCENYRMTGKCHCGLYKQ